jgi:dienelactone hydrolase
MKRLSKLMIMSVILSGFNSCGKVAFAANFVPQPQVDAFRKSIDSAGLTYVFKIYKGTTNAFTNPNATEKGKEFDMPIRYSGAADKASWNDMKAFFQQIL